MGEMAAKLRRRGSATAETGGLPAAKPNAATAASPAADFRSGLKARPSNPPSEAASETPSPSQTPSASLSRPASIAPKPNLGDLKMKPKPPLPPSASNSTSPTSTSAPMQLPVTAPEPTGPGQEEKPASGFQERLKTAKSRENFGSNGDLSRKSTPTPVAAKPKPKNEDDEWDDGAETAKKPVLPAAPSTAPMTVQQHPTQEEVAPPKKLVAPVPIKKQAGADDGDDWDDTSKKTVSPAPPRKESQGANFQRGSNAALNATGAGAEISPSPLRKNVTSSIAKGSNMSLNEKMREESKVQEVPQPAPISNSGMRKSNSQLSNATSTPDEPQQTVGARKSVSQNGSARSLSNLRNPTLNSSSHVASSSGGPIASGGWEDMKRELMAEFKEELQRVKLEIIDAMRIELLKMAKALADD